MKKIIILLVILLSQKVYSQITFSFQPSCTNYQFFQLVDNETKLIDFDINKISSLHQFQLYNIDGSPFKSIQVPLDPNYAGITNIGSISRTLFDNDPSNIEYLVTYFTDSSQYIHRYKTKVIREDGTILLDELYAQYGIIYQTESGAKLMLYYYWAGWGVPFQTKVFNLTGHIPSEVENNLIESDKAISLYPNPNNGSFYLKINKNYGNDYNIDLYSTMGTLIDSFKSTGNPTHIIKPELSEGIYLLNTQIKGVNSSIKMILKH